MAGGVRAGRLQVAARGGIGGRGQDTVERFTRDGLIGESANRLPATYGVADLHALVTHPQASRFRGRPVSYDVLEGVSRWYVARTI